MTQNREPKRLRTGRTMTDEFARYFRHLAERVDKAARSVTEDQFWIKPFPFGNSIGHLVLHLTGNLNHYIGALVAGTGYVRHREHEFTDPTRYPRDQVLAQVPSGRGPGRADAVIPGRIGVSHARYDQPPIQTRLGCSWSARPI